MTQATRALDALIPYARNARTHSDEQVEQLEASMVLFGWTIPVLIDENGGVIAGHGRILAAERVYARGDAITGLDGKPIKKGHVPVLVAVGWSEEQKRAYVLADNKLAEGSTWDDDLLREELLAVLDHAPMVAIGYSEAELSKILAVPDPIGDPPENRYTEQYGVVVVCTDESQQREVYERLRDDGLSVRVVKV